MLRVLLYAWLTTTMCASPLSAFIVNVDVQPAAPMPGDSVRLIVDGYFPDGCWVIEDEDFDTSGFQFEYTVRALDTWVPGVA